MIETIFFILLPFLMVGGIGYAGYMAYQGSQQTVADVKGIKCIYRKCPEHSEA